MTLYNTTLTLVAVCGLNGPYRNRSFCEYITDISKVATDFFAFTSFS